MNLFIYSLAQTIFEGESSLITLPTEDGEISVLPHHSKLVTSLCAGKIVFKTATGKERVAVERGIAYIDGQNTVILAD